MLLGDCRKMVKKRVYGCQQMRNSTILRVRGIGGTGVINKCRDRREHGEVNGHGNGYRPGRAVQELVGFVDHGVGRARKRRERNSQRREE